MANGNAENARVFDDDVIETRLPHSGFGDPDCCGCLCGALKGDHALQITVAIACEMVYV